MMTLPNTPCYVSVLLLQLVNGGWGYLIIAVEDDNCRRGDGDPYGEGIARAAPVFPGHFDDTYIKLNSLRSCVKE